MRLLLYLCRGVLVALHPVQGLLRGVDRKLWGVIATTQATISYLHCTPADISLQKALTHVHNRLNGGSRSGFVDDGPGRESVRQCADKPLWRVTHQTSCRCPATLFAGRKGSERGGVAAMVRTPRRMRGGTDGQKRGLEEEDASEWLCKVSCLVTGDISERVAGIMGRRKNEEEELRQKRLNEEIRRRSTPDQGIWTLSSTTSIWAVHSIWRRYKLYSGV